MTVFKEIHRLEFTWTGPFRNIIRGTIVLAKVALHRTDLLRCVFDYFSVGLSSNTATLVDS